MIRVKSAKCECGTTLALSIFDEDDEEIALVLLDADEWRELKEAGDQILAS